MRLIDADALVNGYDVRKVTEYDEAGFSMNYKAVPLDVIEEAPTIEVVGEPVLHSMWIKHAAAQNTYLLDMPELRHDGVAQMEAVPGM